MQGTLYTPDYQARRIFGRGLKDILEQYKTRTPNMEQIQINSHAGFQGGIHHPNTRRCIGKQEQHSTCGCPLQCGSWSLGCPGTGSRTLTSNLSRP